MKQQLYNKAKKLVATINLPGATEKQQVTAYEELKKIERSLAIWNVLLEVSFKDNDTIAIRVMNETDLVL